MDWHLESAPGADWARKGGRGLGAVGGDPFLSTIRVLASISRDLLMKIHTQVLINSGLLPGPLEERPSAGKGAGNELHLSVKRLANIFNSLS